MIQHNAMQGENFRLEDVRKFLAVFHRITSAPFAQKKTVKDLFHGLGPHSTTLGQLSRLLDSLVPHEAPSASNQSVDRMDLLFEKKSGEGLMPTKLATLLNTYLRTLPEYYQDLCALVSKATCGQTSEKEVKIGAPQFLAYRFLSFALSDPTPAVAENTHLSVEIGESFNKLLPSLKVGHLDCVVTYVPKSGRGVPDPELPHIRYSDLGYRQRMILITHPDFRVPVRDGKLRNGKLAADLKVTSVRSQKTTDDALCVGYSQLEEISLHNIDFRKTRLIVAPSWRQPNDIQDAITAATHLNNAKDVTWYDDCVSQVRMKAGISIVPAAYAREPLIASLRLPSTENCTRLLGVYYDARRNMTSETCKVLEFMRVYLKYIQKTNASDLPATGSPKYPAGLSFDPSQDWDRVLTENYPSETCRDVNR